MYTYTSLSLSLYIYIYTHIQTHTHLGARRRLSGHLDQRVSESNSAILMSCLISYKGISFYTTNETTQVWLFNEVHLKRNPLIGTSLREVLQTPCPRAPSRLLASSSRKHCLLRPISLLTLSLLTLLDSNFPRNSLWAWEFHPLELRLCLSQTLWNPQC